MPDADLKAVAVDACEAAGAVVRNEFRQGHVVGEYEPDDVKTELDRRAEAKMLSIIHDTFPTHRIRAEESGRHEGAAHAVGTDSPYEWVLDPLDGTNNVAAQLPLFATAAAVRQGDRTVLSVIHEPLTGDTYVASRGDGATLNGQSMSGWPDRPLDRATISLILGLDVVRTEALANRGAAIRSALESTCKRVLTTWAPCVDWALLARGGIAAVVTFHPDPWEDYAGELLARGAGAVEWTDGPLAVHGRDADITDRLRAVITAA